MKCYQCGKNASASKGYPNGWRVYYCSSCADEIKMNEKIKDNGDDLDVI